jgi:hypothetical protein
MFYVCTSFRTDEGDNRPFAHFRVCFKNYTFYNIFPFHGKFNENNICTCVKLAFFPLYIFIYPNNKLRMLLRDVIRRGLTVQVIRFLSSDKFKCSIYVQ